MVQNKLYQMILLVSIFTTAVSIGSGNFADPEVSIKTIAGIEEYMKKHSIENLIDIIGTVKMN